MRTPSLTKIVGLIMNLISKTHHLCKRREYTFMVFRKYIIIFHVKPKKTILERARALVLW